MRKNSIFPLVLFIAALICTSDSYAQRFSKRAGSQRAANRVWTIAEILEEKRRDKPKKPISYCNGGRFKACVCPTDVAREVQYRPSVEECSGNAGIALTGKYGSIFSAVVRDRENRDRFPPAGSGYGGCSFEEADAVNPPSKCSAFKAQKAIRIGSGRDKGRLYCLGASGYSSIFANVSRITAKLADDPNGSSDPIVRWCLKKSTLPLN